MCSGRPGAFLESFTAEAGGSENERCLIHNAVGVARMFVVVSVTPGPRGSGPGRGASSFSIIHHDTKLDTKRGVDIV